MTLRISYVVTFSWIFFLSLVLLFIFSLTTSFFVVFVRSHVICIDKILSFPYIYYADPRTANCNMRPTILSLILRERMICDRLHLERLIYLSLRRNQIFIVYVHNIFVVFIHVWQDNLMSKFFLIILFLVIIVFVYIRMLREQRTLS